MQVLTLMAAGRQGVAAAALPCSKKSESCFISAARCQPHLFTQPIKHIEGNRMPLLYANQQQHACTTAPGDARAARPKRSVNALLNRAAAGSHSSTPSSP